MAKWINPYERKKIAESASGSSADVTMSLPVTPQNEADMEAIAASLPKTPLAPGPTLLEQEAQNYSPLQAGLIAAGKESQGIYEGAADIKDQLMSLAFDNPAAKQGISDRRARMAENERLYQPLATAHPYATALGESVPHSVASPSSLLGSAAFSGLLGGVSYNDTLEERAKNAAIAGGSAAAGNALSRMILGRPMQQSFSGAPKIDADQRDVLANGERLGFWTKPSVRAGNSRGLKIKEAELESNQRTTDSIADIAEHNNKRFNQIASNQFGSDASRLTPKVLREAKQRLGKKFDRLTKDQSVSLDQDFFNEIGRISSSFDEALGRPKGKVGKIYDEIFEESFNGVGAITSEKYQRWTSGLVKDAMGAMDSDPAYAHALLDIRKALDDAFDKSVGNKAEILKARDQYRQFLFVKDATDPGTGNVSAPKLSNALKRDDEWGYVYGNKKNPIYDALRYLRQFPDNFGRSGTAERTPSKGFISTVVDAAAKGGLVSGLNPIGSTLAATGAAANYAATPLSSRLFASKALNQGLLNPLSRKGPLGLLATDDAQAQLRRMLSPNLEAYARQSYQ